MKTDYKKYKLSKGERMKFIPVAYVSCTLLAYLFYRSIILSLIFGLFFVFAEKYYCDYLLGRQKEEMRRQFKDLMYSLSSSVASGRYMSEALLEAQKNLEMIYGKDALMVNELNGINKSISESRERIEDVLYDFAERSANEDIRNFVEVYNICQKTGGDIQRVISNTTGVILDKMQMQREIKTLMAQKQFEARIVSIMPLVIIIFLNLISPDYLSPLYETIMGRIIMSIALFGFIVACVWMFKLTEVDDI